MTTTGIIGAPAPRVVAVRELLLAARHYATVTFMPSAFSPGSHCSARLSKRPCAAGLTATENWGEAFECVLG
jgi:hypothetical protein